MPLLSSSSWAARGVVVLAVLAVPHALVSATLLYVSSYAGNITTLRLTGGCTAGHCTAHDSLEAVAWTTGCMPNPSWLTLDGSVLYCVDEGLEATHGSLSSFGTSKNGSLVRLDKIDTLSGPVSSVVYGHGGRGMAVAEYAGSSLSSYSIADPAALTHMQTTTFRLAQRGPNASRQDVPHPHDVLLDPTGQFLLVPDLGADLVRVFTVNATSLGWMASTPLVAAPGSGPRHAAFVVTPRNKTLLYVVSELANTITGYEVAYNGNNTLGFRQVYLSGSHGLNGTVPRGAAVAEVQATPDGQYLIVSSRNESSFSLGNGGAANNSRPMASDALISFAVDHATGGLTALQTFPAGGIGPRQFAINRAGDRVVVGLQADERVVVINRDVRTGLLTGFAASIAVAGNVTCVVLDEAPDETR